MKARWLMCMFVMSGLVLEPAVSPAQVTTGTILGTVVDPTGAAIPGASTGQQGGNLSGASTFSPRAASDYNALGSQANTNAWLVDGIWDNEYTFNTVLVQPSVESVQEFKVLTGTYSAEFGGGAGVVSVSTRSGSNALHREAFESLRNRALDAKPYQFTPTPVVKPPFKRNQFGAAVGGPIRRNKTFFF